MKQSLRNRPAEVQWNETIRETSKFVHLENFIAQTTVSRGGEEKEKVMHSGTHSILDGLYWCSDDIFEVTSSSNSSCRLMPLVLSYCRNIPNGNDIPKARNVTMANGP